MLKPFASALALALIIGSAHAPSAVGQTVAEQRTHAIYSLNVQGKIVIGTDGAVTSYEIDHTSKMQPTTRAFVERNVSGWRFKAEQPGALDKPVETRFSMTILGMPSGKNEITLQAQSPYFHAAEMNDAGMAVDASRLTPPPYPHEALRSGVSGVVFLAIKVGRDGKVMDVAAMQVNLRNVGRPTLVESFRRVLANASIAQARKDWNFAPLREDWQGEFTTVIVPVDYMRPDGQIGDWNVHFPGPKQRIPWETDRFNAIAAPESMPAGRLYSPDMQASRIRLLQS